MKGPVGNRYIRAQQQLLALFAFVLLADLTRLLFTKKISYLFVDDWAIFKDFSTIDQGLNSTNLAPYNGHSLLVTRIIFIFATKNLGIEISTFSIFITILLIGSVCILARRISSGETRVLKPLSVSIVILVSLNLNQYQNLTMPICWSWMLCLIYIIWTYIIVNQDLNVYRGAVLIVLSLLGPLTLSLGFIIPFFIILKLSYDFYLSKRNKSVIFLLVCIVSCTIFTYISAIVNSESEYGSFSNPITIVTSPINSLIFLLTSIGMPFSPASRFSVQIASAFGLIISILLIKILRETKSFASFMGSDALISLGLLFHMIHLIGRYDGTWLSIMIAAQPRYSTGAIILILGIFTKLIGMGNQKINFLIVILVGVMTVSGMKTAEDFSSVRNGASEIIKDCVSKHSLSSAKCKILLDPGRKVLTELEYNKAIDYLEGLK